MFAVGVEALLQLLKVANNGASAKHIKGPQLFSHCEQL